MPYINDVFISYKRGKINEQWLEEIFLPIFSDYLDNELPHKPKIFVDKTGLTPGVNYNDELFINLLYSKCVVSIWSPPYFRKSEYCVAEFLTMKYRQEVLQLNPLTVPKTLIWSIVYRKIDPIPHLASGITFSDYTNFNVVGDAFFKTEKYLFFQEKMNTDIKSIADIINNVPPLKPEWETPDGRKMILDDLNLYFSQNEIETPQKQSAIVWQVK